MQIQTHAPHENLEIFGLLYELETSLRELIIEELSSRFGEKWYKQRLPGEVLQKYREGVTAERQIKWSQLTPHHPIYYTDFAHLKVVIQNRPNWDDVFAGIFGRKDTFEGLMAQLEFVRNKIAHNRKANATDVAVVRTAHQQLAGMIGQDRMVELASRCTRMEALSEKLKTLRAECDVACEAAKNFKPIGTLAAWNSIQHIWWFDESYLGFPLNKVTELFATLAEYGTLARGRGTGHIIEQWTKDHNLSALYEAAISQLDALYSTS